MERETWTMPGGTTWECLGCVSTQPPLAKITWRLCFEVAWHITKHLIWVTSIPGLTSSAFVDVRGLITKNSYFICTICCRYKDHMLILWKERSEQFLSLSCDSIVTDKSRLVPTVPLALLGLVPVFVQSCFVARLVRLLTSLFEVDLNSSAMVGIQKFKYPTHSFHLCSN